MINTETEQRDHYEVFQDRVVQGPFVAQAISPTTISSNYIAGRREDSQPPKDQIHWKLTADISAYPSYSSDQLLVDALYNLSLEELVLNTESDGTFRTGALWEGVWTRDISYSILLSLGVLNPEVSKTSLRKKVKNGRIIQDTGTGGAYPVSTDRVVWAVAAWEIYLVTGDNTWLEEIFPIIQATIEDDWYNAFDPETGLMKGESSFLDWREQSYPEWMQPADIYESEALGTNAVHYSAHVILSEMGKIRGDSELFKKYRNSAEAIKKSINDHLWIGEKGFYGQYLYGRTHKILSPRAETLGESLAVLFDIADQERQREIVEKNPVGPFGIPCIFPQIPDTPAYHNDGSWPFVQAFWSMAAAKVGDVAILTQSLDSNYRASALFLTNKENFVASSGDENGTLKNSDRQLWSVAGTLGSIYKVFFGMVFRPDGLEFHPTVPEKYVGKKSIKGFCYRECGLDIELHGFGSKIKSVRLDGKAIKEATIPAGLQGLHRLEIYLDSSGSAKRTLGEAAHAVSPRTPFLNHQDGQLSWARQEAIHHYHIVKDGRTLHQLQQETWELPSDSCGEYQVIAVDKQGYSSFASEPITITAEPPLEIDLSLSALAYEQRCPNISGGGYIPISLGQNLRVTFEVEVEDAGIYALSIRYANGNGPVNTDNKCALRALMQNEIFVGTLIFPQRGINNWEEWGESNTLKVALKKGVNRFTLSFESFTHNMDGEVNDAFLDRVRLVKISGEIDCPA